MRILSQLLAAALLLAAAPVLADEYKVGDIVITSPWIRATPPSAPTGAGFVTIANTGDAADRLVAAASPIAGQAELHRMEVTDGVMRMRAMPAGIEIPPGETVALKPGSFHIMFLDLAGPIEQGAPVPVTLTFEKGGPVEVDMAVAPPGAPGPDHGHGHEGGN